MLSLHAPRPIWRHERAGAVERFGKRLRYWYRRNIGFKAVDLADVEDGERAEHRPRSGRRRLVRLVFFAFRIETLHQNDRGAALATANLAASLVRLAEGHPGVGGVPAPVGGIPQDGDIDPPVRATGRGVPRHEATVVAAALPGLEPRKRAALQLFDDTVCDGAVQCIDVQGRSTRL